MPARRIYTLSIVPEALTDIDRLDTFLRPDNPNAANRMQDLLRAGFRNLIENPRRGVAWAMSPESQDIRELFMPFGKRGYVIRYEIIVTRIFHAREDRQSD